MTHDHPREGLSLAAVTDIAANPPAVFDDMQHVLQDPLVLYIARVPGSRDVFLTTLKPREKIVTAEDVQSCLYYVHASQHEGCEEADLANEDAILRQDPCQTKPAAPSIKTVGNFSHDISLIGSKPIARKPVGGPVTVRRKPLSSTAKTPRYEQDTNHWRASTQMSRVHPLPPTPHEMHPSLHEMHAVPPNFSSPSLPASPNPASILTLIRRDPGTSSQWNVARVVDLETESDHEPERKKTTHVKKNNSRRPFHVVVLNKNYGCFRNESTLHSDRNSVGQGTELAYQGVLQRSVYTPRQNQGVSYDDTFTTTDNIPVRPVSLSSINADRVGESAHRPPSTSTVSKRRGLVFTSPWGGLCEFVTGITGTSLKCRYLVADAELSELRFNLPTTSRPTESSHQIDVTQPDHKRFSRIASNWPLQKTPSTSQHDDDHAPLNLALGRERAGGGFGGKQAKLGKLIIEPPGLKMLDLLVAANIGLWWRAYERGKD